MRQSGCKPGRRSADFRMEGSKPTHGKGNRVLHPEPLSEKSDVGSPSKVREGNRVLHTSKEVGIAYWSVRSLACVARRAKCTQRNGTAAMPVLGDLQGASVRIDRDDRPRFPIAISWGRRRLSSRRGSCTPPSQSSAHPWRDRHRALRYRRPFPSRPALYSSP
jgi:hypothetical protein